MRGIDPRIQLLIIAGRLVGFKKRGFAGVFLCGDSESRVHAAEVLNRPGLSVPTVMGSSMESKKRIAKVRPCKHHQISPTRHRQHSFLET